MYFGSTELTRACCSVRQSSHAIRSPGLLSSLAIQFETAGKAKIWTNIHFKAVETFLRHSFLRPQSYWWYWGREVFFCEERLGWTSDHRQKWIRDIRARLERVLLYTVRRADWGMQCLAGRRAPSFRVALMPLLIRTGLSQPCGCSQMGTIKCDMLCLGMFHLMFRYFLLLDNYGQ